MTTGRVEFINPDGLNRNPAFTNVAVVSGPVRTIYVGGQDSITAEGEIVGKGDISAQTEQVLMNVQTALAAAGAGPEHVIKWNCTDRRRAIDRTGLRRLPARLGQPGGPAADHGGVRVGTRTPGLPRRDGRDRGGAAGTTGLRRQARDVVVFLVDGPDRVERDRQRAFRAGSAEAPQGTARARQGSPELRRPRGRSPRFDNSGR